MNHAGLSSLAFSWMLLDERSGIVANSDGALFEKPNELSVESVRLAATNIPQGGWGVCAAGYAFIKVPTQQLIGVNELVIFGLKINGLSSARGKTEQLSIKTERQHVEKYLSKFLIGMSGIEEQHNSLIRQSIHEIRGLNSALYNAAFELENLLHKQAGRGGMVILP